MAKAKAAKAKDREPSEWKRDQLWYRPGHSTSRDHRRLDFLHSAAQVKPELLQSLREIGPDDDAALSAWAQKWNLTDPWCLALARLSLEYWKSNPKSTTWDFVKDGDEVLLFLYSRREPLPHDAPDIKIDRIRWNPTWITRAQFEEEWLEIMRMTLEPYCDQVEDLMNKAGYRQETRKRSPDHFKWLARYQCCTDETFDSIATSCAKSRPTVTEGIKSAADSIELTLRPATKAGARKIR